MLVYKRKRAGVTPVTGQPISLGNTDGDLMGQDPSDIVGEKKARKEDRIKYGQ